MIATNDLIYLVTNVFYPYILCKFMRAFFEQKGRNRKAEILSFVAYYCIISIIYVGFHTPIITVLSNLVLYYLLSFNYGGNLKLRISSAIFIYALLSSSEAIALLFLQFWGLNHFTGFNHGEYLLAQVVIGLICLVLVLVFSNYKLQKKKQTIPVLYWVCIVIIPFCSLIPIFVISKDIFAKNNFVAVVSVAVLLMINILMF